MLLIPQSFSRQLQTEAVITVAMGRKRFNEYAPGAAHCVAASQVQGFMLEMQKSPSKICR